MKAISRETGISADTCENSAWRLSESVERWCNALLHIIGCSPSEIAGRLDILMRFCAEYAVSPDRMIGECRRHPDRAAQRKLYLGAARDSDANLIVQSFLIHNGINIFGELVCMPATAEGIQREQGTSTTPR